MELTEKQTEQWAELIASATDRVSELHDHQSDLSASYHWFRMETSRVRGLAIEASGASSDAMDYLRELNEALESGQDPLMWKLSR